MRPLSRTLLLPVFLGVFLATTAQAQWTWTPQTGRWINLKRLPKETAELQMEFARSLLVAGEYDKAWRETEKFEQFYSESEFADENQFLRGEIRFAQGRYLDAAKAYQQLIAAHPETDLYDKAIAKQYEIGDALYARGQEKLKDKWALYKKRPLKRAIEVYSMVIDNQPFTPQAAEAQYKVGLCHYAREEYVEAAFEYRRVVEDYSASDWVDEASYGLAMCYYKDSLPPDYDQSPSQLAVEAVDTFVERYPNDERVPELQKMRGEMMERMAAHRLQIAQFYEKRREFKSAKIYYQVVVDQFAGTPAAEQAQEWLAAHPGVNVGLKHLASAQGNL
ncbi:MAG: outer membrane protein assembly factor BamD [Candidatus Hydrogenedentes bacterium]|nr:outer membrane protein assembly factor BamD [Candidatus Hydrogenedentota bacterium]MBI3117830.1 outer membrane protein assembly factor BamD [Candidatus Hydrogenedentota bacterium]